MVKFSQKARSKFIAIWLHVYGRGCTAFDLSTSVRSHFNRVTNTGVRILTDTSEIGKYRSYVSVGRVLIPVTRNVHSVSILRPKHVYSFKYGIQLHNTSYGHTASVFRVEVTYVLKLQGVLSSETLVHNSPHGDMTYTNTSLAPSLHNSQQV